MRNLPSRGRAIVGYQRISDLSAPVKPKEKLSPQQLVDLVDSLPGESSLDYDGRFFHNHELRTVRGARRDFRTAQSIVLDLRRPQEERLAAAKVMGHKLGIWSWNFGLLLGIPFQEGLVVDEAVFGDAGACDAMVAGYKEYLLGNDSDSSSTVFELFSTRADRQRTGIDAEDACTLLECGVRHLQRTRKEPAEAGSTKNKKPSRKA